MPNDAHLLRHFLQPGEIPGSRAAGSFRFAARSWFGERRWYPQGHFPPCSIPFPRPFPLHLSPTDFGFLRWLRDPPGNQDPLRIFFCMVAAFRIAVRGFPFSLSSPKDYSWNGNGKDSCRIAFPFSWSWWICRGCLRDHSEIVTVTGIGIFFLLVGWGFCRDLFGFLRKILPGFLKDFLFSDCFGIIPWLRILGGRGLRVVDPGFVSGSRMILSGSVDPWGSSIPSVGLTRRFIWVHWGSVLSPPDYLKRSCQGSCQGSCHWPILGSRQDRWLPAHD